MTSVILQSASRVLPPLILFFSVVMLLQGHDGPGGGFVGGLAAAAGFALHGIAFGTASLRRTLHVDPERVAGAGLLLALAAGATPLFSSEPFLSGMWRDAAPGEPILLLGTPLVFDIGVYLLVVGTTLTILGAFGREHHA